jgi:shikimate dehydrogenase
MPDPVLTLSDLESWSFAGTALAVLGHPIGHSLSPGMHNAALAALAEADPRFAGWSYFRFDVLPADLPKALDLLRAKRFHGINLTVPHKVIAFGLVSEIDGDARPIGAVNTLLRTDGGWRGCNTDGYGLASGLAESLHQNLAGADILILGAGGAARAAAVECLRRGCATLRIANRSGPNLDALLEVLRPLAGKIPLLGVTLPAAALRDAGLLVINATSAGLGAGDASPLDLATLVRPAGVYDMIYHPPRTALLRQAESLGVPCANGLSMLAHQGAKALEIWTGAPAAQTAPGMLAAARAAPSS